MQICIKFEIYTKNNTLQIKPNLQQ